jgi:hypothetical protein
MTRALVLSTLLLAAACASSKSLPKPDGQVFRINPEKWAERVNDLRQEVRR